MAWIQLTLLLNKANLIKFGKFKKLELQMSLSRLLSRSWVSCELTFCPPQCLKACLYELSKNFFLWKDFLICLIQWSVRKSESFPKKHDLLTYHGADLLEGSWGWFLRRLRSVFACEWIPTVNQGSPLSILTSQWVSSGLQQYIDVSGLDSLQIRASSWARHTLLSSLGASWFLPALAALHSAACDFLWFSPCASRRGTILLPRARMGHPHLDLNVGGFVAFGIQFWN